MLASGLKSAGHDVCIVSLDGAGDLDVQASALGIKTTVIEKRRLKLLRSSLSYIRAVRCARPDLVYAFLPKQHIVATIAKVFTSPAKIVWGIRASEIDWSQYRMRSRIFFPLATRLSRYADLFIANSWSGADYHISLGYRLEKMTVIPNGIDSSVFYPDYDKRIKSRESWNVIDNVPVVGMLARFDPMKGNEDFLRVAASVLQQVPETIFVAAGHHSEEQGSSFRENAQTLGLQNNLLLLQATERPEFFLNGLDVLLVPSKSEGFPNTVLEALACGIPVVGTNVGDIRRIIGERYSKAGFGDIETMADGVLELLRKSHNYEVGSQHSQMLDIYSDHMLIHKTISALARIL
jgi:glycosyltransferase involved in cell wall biosynthesis